MSLTETHRHWLSGYTLCTADSKSVVKVAMPHLRGRWSPTKAILRIFAVSLKWNPFPIRGTSSVVRRLLLDLYCGKTVIPAKAVGTPSRTKRQEGQQPVKRPMLCLLEQN